MLSARYSGLRVFSFVHVKEDARLKFERSRLPTLRVRKECSPMADTSQSQN
jgi:hypothetical protein